MRVGILGSGHFAKTYAQVLDKNGAVVVAVSARNESKAKELFPKAVFFADWKALVKNAEIDLLIVCVPIFMHFEVISLALDSGRQILSEKPVAETIDQAEQLVERYSRRKSNHSWMVAENYRLEPVFAKAQVFFFFFFFFFFFSQKVF